MSFTESPLVNFANNWSGNLAINNFKVDINNIFRKKNVISSSQYWHFRHFILFWNSVYFWHFSNIEYCQLKAAKSSWKYYFKLFPVTWTISVHFPVLFTPSDLRLQLDFHLNFINTYPQKHIPVTYPFDLIYKQSLILFIVITTVSCCLARSEDRVHIRPCVQLKSLLAPESTLS